MFLLGAFRSSWWKISAENGTGGWWGSTSVVCGHEGPEMGSGAKLTADETHEKAS